MIGAEEDVSVAFDAEFLHCGAHARKLKIHVVLARDRAERLAAHTRDQFACLRERRGRGFLFAAEAVMRELQVERLARLDLLAHELDALVDDQFALLRIRRDAALRALV